MFLPLRWRPYVGDLSIRCWHSHSSNGCKQCHKIRGFRPVLTGLKMFISRNVLSATFEAAGLLVFLPILFLYSTLLGLIVLGFAIFLGTLVIF